MSARRNVGARSTAWSIGTAATQANADKSNGVQARNHRQPLKDTSPKPTCRLDARIIGRQAYLQNYGSSPPARARRPVHEPPVAARCRNANSSIGAFT